MAFSNQLVPQVKKKSLSSLGTVASEVHHLGYWELSGLTTPSFLPC